MANSHITQSGEPVKCRRDKGEYMRFDAEREIRRSKLEPLTMHLLNIMWQLADARTGIVPRPVSISELVSHTHMSKSSVLRNLEKAEQAGFLVRSVPAKRDQITKHDANQYRLTTPDQVHQPSVCETPAQVVDHSRASVCQTPELVSDRHTPINRVITGGVGATRQDTPREEPKAECPSCLGKLRADGGCDLCDMLRRHRR